VIPREKKNRLRVSENKVLRRKCGQQEGGSDRKMEPVT
jgi:hypothetical protein